MIFSLKGVNFQGLKLSMNWCFIIFSQLPMLLFCKTLKKKLWKFVSFKSTWWTLKAVRLIYKLSGYLMYWLMEKYLTGTFKEMYKISTQSFNMFVEGLGDFSVYSHLLFPSIWQFLELVFYFFFNDSSAIPRIKWSVAANFLEYWILILENSHYILPNLDTRFLSSKRLFLIKKDAQNLCLLFQWKQFRLHMFCRPFHFLVDL